MNDWMEPFLRECIGKIPDSAYRDQVKKELTDHLEELADTFETGGYAPQQARQLALSRMGDPKVLFRTFQKEFLRRQPVNLVNCIEEFLFGSLLAGGMYFVALFVMGLLLSYRNLGPVIPVEWMRAAPLELLRGIYGCGMFLLPFWMETRYLMREFSSDPRRNVIVTCGLWVTWAGEKLAALLLGFSIYHIRDIPALVTAICYEDGLAPWFTVPYILLTFIGCPVLVFLASQFENLAESRGKSLA